MDVSVSSTQLGVLANERTDLTVEEIEYLQLLLQDWTLMADLAFADLVLWLPTWNVAGFIAVAQIRPSTSRTHIPDDLVSHFAPKGRHFELDRAMTTGQVAYGAPAEGHEITMAIPVRRDGKTIAILGRYAAAPQPGRLESIYAHLSDVLTDMVMQGEFPRPSGDDQGTGGRGGAPRVGDGLIVMDKLGAITFASPNARSAFRRLGIGIDIEGQVLADLVARLNKPGRPIDDTLALVARGRIQATSEIEGANSAATLRSIPLVRTGQPHGTIMLVRDVTDIRRREQALLGKDATIREIHHRVKNNLQTVASLLRLQSRRLTDDSAKDAIAEAVRRVGAIAVVHDLLAHEPADVVNFDEVISRVVALTIETTGGVNPQHKLVGKFGQLSSDLATPMSLVLAELVANAVEHGSPRGPESCVTVKCSRAADYIQVDVSDEGPGIELPVADTNGLGLSIVNTLVQDELHGEITFELQPTGGTNVRLVIPLN